MNEHARLIPDYPNHPLADTFPMIEGQALEDLKADIRQNGILQPITIWDDGKGLRILDGRNRYAAGKAINFAFTFANFKTFTGTRDEAEAFAISTNVQRRHLTNAQKQEVIKKLVIKYPTLSNRQIAKKCGMSHATVGAVREKVLNPPELERFREFKATWEELPDDQRLTFVAEFAADLREMLGGQVVQNK